VEAVSKSQKAGRSHYSGSFFIITATCIGNSGNAEEMQLWPRLRETEKAQIRMSRFINGLNRKDSSELTTKQMVKETLDMVRCITKTRTQVQAFRQDTVLAGHVNTFLERLKRNQEALERATKVWPNRRN
jgi:hypothetical protein